MRSQNILSSRPRALALSGLVGVAFAISAAPAHAQQSEIDVLRQQIAEMQARLDKLESTKIDAKPLAEKIGSSSKLPVTVSGLLQVHGYAGVSGEQVSLAQNNKSTTRLRRGEIRITAPNITNNIAGTIQLDFAKTSAITNSAFAAANPGQNVPATQTIGSERNAVLQEIQLTWTAQRTPTSSVLLDIGQFKIPYGFEGDLVSSAALPFVERAQFFRQSFGGGQSSVIRIAGDQRDQGVRLRGNFGEFSYDLGGFLGLGERQNANGDVDSQKAAATRLIYRPKALDGLAIGASYAKGGVSASNFANPFLDAGGAIVSVDRDFYNAFLTYRKDKLSAQAEFFDGDLKGAGTRNVDVRSYYASLGYLLSPQLEAVLRYDQFSTRATNAAGVTGDRLKTTESILGLNYYIKGNNAKIQTNLVQVKRPDTSALDPKSLELRANFQVSF